jgi:hypothetical protein
LIDFGDILTNSTRRALSPLFYYSYRCLQLCQVFQLSAP